MPDVRLDLNNIRYFIEAAQAGSFSAAARALQAPPSMVSRKIAQLEREIGARLFQRTTRSVQLTRAGQAFLDRSIAGVGQFQLALEALGELQHRPRGRVRLTAPVGLGDALWQAVALFMHQYPEVRVKIELVDRFVDLNTEQFDMALRYTREESIAHLIGRRLFRSPRWLLASPHYLQSRGEPKSVRDLAKHECVILGADAEHAAWNLRVGSANRRVVVSGRIAVNEARIAARCAAEGLGIAFLPRAACAAHIADGTLVRVLPRVSGGDLSLGLVYPDRHLTAPARALVHFLADKLAPILSQLEPG